MDGTVSQTSSLTMLKYQKLRLARLYKPKIFLDDDAEYFQIVLNFLRNWEVFTCDFGVQNLAKKPRIRRTCQIRWEALPPNDVFQELRFYGIKEFDHFKNSPGTSHFISWNEKTRYVPTSLKTNKIKLSRIIQPFRCK